MKNHILQILTSLSSLFPDKFLSILLITKQRKTRGRTSIENLEFWKENWQTPIILFIIKADNILRNGHFLYLCPINHL